MPPEAKPEDHVRTVVLGGRARNTEASGGVSMAAFGAGGAPGAAPGAMQHGGGGGMYGSGVAAPSVAPHGAVHPFMSGVPSPGAGGYGAAPAGGYGGMARGGAGLPAGAW